MRLFPQTSFVNHFISVRIKLQKMCNALMLWIIMCCLFVLSGPYIVTGLFAFLWLAWHGRRKL